MTFQKMCLHHISDYPLATSESDSKSLADFCNEVHGNALSIISNDINIAESTKYVIYAILRSSIDNSFDGIVDRANNHQRVFTGYIRIKICYAEISKLLTFIVNDNGSGVVNSKTSDIFRGGEGIGEGIIEILGEDFRRKYSENGSVSKIVINLQKYLNMTPKEARILVSEMLHFQKKSSCNP